MKRNALVLMRQVTLADVRAAASHLDVPTFLRQTSALVPYTPDVPTDEDTKLVRALIAIPLGAGTTIVERLAPYQQAGVVGDWRKIVCELHLRGHSALAHPEAVYGGDYTLDGNGMLPAGRVLGPRQRLLRPRARTLKVTLERKPGDSELARILPTPVAATSDALFDALVEELEKRIRPTTGGDAFLAPDPASRALSVLASTVAAILSDASSQRGVGGLRVVRADVYKGIFDALGLDDYFDVAREVLERDHPHHRSISAPWPPGEGVEGRDLGIVEYRGGYMTLAPRAFLPSLPPPLLGRAEGDPVEDREDAGDRP